MADLTVTASQVSLYTGRALQDQIAGEAFTTGASVYLKSTDRKWYKAQADGTVDEAGAQAVGLALAAAEGVGARVSVAGAGCVVTMGAGAAPVAGTVYMVSNTAGGVAPSTDVVTATNKRTVLGIGVGTNRIFVSPIYNAGSVVP